jgi:NADPH:quinone reductase-like Zn-dependent oxidoreductase
MKAAQISQFGGSSVVQVVEVEKPTPKDGFILVKVHASSLNPFDSKMREGKVPFNLPAILGGDIAGVVEAIGVGAEGFAVGDNVYGAANILGGNGGGFAEYTLTKPAQLGKMPANVSFTEAASLSLTGVSALQGIVDHINLKQGQKILIHGGSGGIGTIAVQIAKHIGAYVATTVSPATKEAVKALGADEVIDYKSQNFEELIHDFDAVFDTVGGATFDRSLDVLKPGGVAVTMIGEPNETAAKEKGVTAIREQTQTTTDRLARLAKLVEAGAVTAQVAEVFPLERIQEAFDASEGGGVLGKIAIEIA